MTEQSSLRIGQQVWWWATHFYGIECQVLRTGSVISFDNEIVAVWSGVAHGQPSVVFVRRANVLLREPPSEDRQ